MSLLEYVLSEEEKLEEKLSFCRSIAYHPFFRSLSEDDTVSSELPASSRFVNVNPKIYEDYRHLILPSKTYVPHLDRRIMDGGCRVCLSRG